ncbi:MAG: sulfatase-like hydrolase/transferase, partial [Planctomycetaceae bacterium]|nr:sulfatase-like hydrolase/transferase [Planctomycetaceae bacterium]
GHLLAGLESSPHAKNTIVVLWSDHGFHLGEKEHWAKRTLWEESTRVPLLFAGPDIVPGEPCREAVSLVDIYPTLIELCGLNERKNLDGVSLVPQLENPRTERKVPVQISSFEGNHAIRSRDWKLIHYADGSEELYDHRIDPQEIKNLIRQPTAESNTIRQKLAAYLPKQAAPEVMSPENQTKFKE